MGESKDIVPEHWPGDIKSVLNKLTEEDRVVIVDHMTRSYMAGYFDGEGTFQFQYGSTVPRIGSQDTECLMLFQKKYGGNIGLESRKGTESRPGMVYNRDYYRWTMTDKRLGPGGHGYILKTKFLLGILPYQHNQSKIRQSIKAIIALRWSARVRWEGLIPKSVDAWLPEDNRISVDEFFR